MLAQADEFQLDLHHDVDRARIEVRVLAQRQGHVLRHRHRVEQRAGLEQNAEVLADLVHPLRVQLGDVPPEQVDLATLDLIRTDHAAQQRALAAPGAPHHHHRLSLVDVERHAVEHLPTVEHLHDIAAGNHRLLAGAGLVGGFGHGHILTTPLTQRT